MAQALLNPLIFSYFLNTKRTKTAEKEAFSQWWVYLYINRAIWTTNMQPTNTAIHHTNKQWIVLKCKSYEFTINKTLWTLNYSSYPLQIPQKSTSKSIKKKTKKNTIITILFLNFFSIFMYNSLWKVPGSNCSKIFINMGFSRLVKHW